MDKSSLIGVAYLIIIGALVVMMFKQIAKELLSSLKTSLHRLKGALWHMPYKAESTAAIDFKDECNAAECAFTRLNIKYEAEDSENERVYHFDFQAGHFMLAMPHNTSRGMRLWFPGFTTIALDHIDCMRIVCNENNSGSTLVEAVYSTNDEK